MYISCQLTYVELFSVLVLNITKKRHTGNCYSHKATFQLYAFNQVIKRLEIQLCRKKYWLYLHKTPLQHSWICCYPCCQHSSECPGKPLPVAQGMESRVPTRGFRWDVSATLGSPKARQASPGRPAQPPSNRFGSFLHVRRVAGVTLGAAGLGTSRTPTAGEQRPVLWVCVFSVAAGQRVG